MRGCAFLPGRERGVVGQEVRLGEERKGAVLHLRTLRVCQREHLGQTIATWAEATETRTSFNLEGRPRLLISTEDQPNLLAPQDDPSHIPISLFLLSTLLALIEQAPHQTSQEPRPVSHVVRLVVPCQEEEMSGEEGQLGRRLEGGQRKEFGCECQQSELHFRLLFGGEKIETVLDRQL